MKLEKNFKQAKSLIKSNQLKALEEIGLLITAESQSRTPVDTGRLRREQSHQVVSDNQVDIGTNVEYGPTIELGSSKRRAQPFLRDAFLQNISSIENIVSKYMSEM